MEDVGTRFYCYCILVVMVTLLVSLNGATCSRPLPPQTTTTTSSPPPLPQLEAAGSSRTEQKPEAETRTNKSDQGVGAQEVIGSRPPRCEHRCNGCSPCEATQVPTNHHIGIQFTNYVPEGWKCKCGPSFFSP
ncbi:Epidermal patterning factor-like protein [Heracleum sosnowskyi]|uniref:Epidermal patterning factor-like protein n=1 Tax=Heracleum sosnowskyi TaxID=360622 RepID=A0AAD8H2J4_9APIA|nr:Epidermal patterning factor-like protein [Heracleum sosnowskyi]